jgi:cytochrome b subunit of formate dehydrogenase
MATGYVLCDAWTELLFIIQIICLEQLRFSLSVFSYECLALMHIFMLFLREGQEGKARQTWNKEVLSRISRTLEIKLISIYF